MLYHLQCDCKYETDKHTHTTADAPRRLSCLYLITDKMLRPEPKNWIKMFPFCLDCKRKKCVILSTKPGNPGVKDPDRSLYISHRKIKPVCTGTSSIAQKSLVAMFLRRQTWLLSCIHARTDIFTSPMFISG